MKLSDNIHLAEQRFIPPLGQFFKSVYDEKILFSHGIDHHRRVWNYAKELLLSSNNQDIINQPAFVEKLIIGCYLHDTGMSVDHGSRHGRHSRKLCEQFLSGNNLDLSDYQDVLEAIENHDLKEYSDSPSDNSLLLFLSVADDLDAFGYVGIYRYLEIYLARGTDPAEAGNQILRNALKRFENFISSFRYSDNLVQKQKIRFEILESFFRNYNRDAASYQFRNHPPSGYCGVTDIILNLIDSKKVLMDYINETKNFSEDPIIAEFFTGLINELS
jgi:HD superfamily phosphodiesterase